MSGSFRDLITTWGFKVDDAPLKRVEAHLGQIKKGVDFLVGTQVVKAMIDMEQRFSRWAHELNSVSIASGVATETIQQLAFAGAQFGATQEEITGAMSSLTLKINEAKMGVESAQRAFGLAGFSGQQLNSWKNGNDALMALADRMHATIDPIRKQAIAAELGVSANSRLYAMLSQGSAKIREMGQEAKDLGAVLSGDQVKGLVDAQNSMSKFSMMIEGVGKTLAAYFAPGVKSAIDSILNFYKANKKIIEINIKAWVDDVLFALGYLYGWIEFMVKAIIRFAEAHPVLFRRITEVIAVIGFLVVGLIALGAILAPILMAWSALTTAFSFIVGIVQGAVTIFGLLTRGLLFLRNVLFWVTTAIELLTAGALPLWATIGLGVAAIGALGGAFYALWQHFVQGKDWKDTWIGKMISGIKEFISGTAGKIASLFGFGEEGEDKNKEGSPEKIAESSKEEVLKDSSVKKPFAMNDAMTALTNLNSAPVIANSNPTMNNVSNVTNSNTLKNVSNNINSNEMNQHKNESNLDVNVPITMNISGSGNPHDVARHVKEGLADHLETIIRNTHKSLKSSVVH